MSRAFCLTFGLLASLLALSVFARGASAAVVDPAYRFRTIETAHFVVYFHTGEEQLAVRLAAIAEDTWQRVRVPLGTVPPGLTHVILVDQSEVANGQASPVPYNAVMITAAWPAGSEFIGKVDDWLRVAFAHEFTHIIHLSRSEGWAKAVRGIFGRVPLAFPNLFLPQWQIEGLATYEESALTGQGRHYAGDFLAVTREAARTRRLEPLDRVNGGLTDWPGGLAAYAYGEGFHAYLAERFGEESLGRLAAATAGRVPYTGSRVFERIYGRSLGSLWLDYQASIANLSDADDVQPGREEAGAAATPQRLTHHGFEVTGPRFDRPSCGGCPAPVVYSVRTPHEFPALYRIARDGSAPSKLATRYLGSTSAITDDAIYFDQDELRRNSGLYGDLYRLNRRTDDIVQLTHEARLLEPDLAPDGQRLVCVRSARDRRELVLLNLSAPNGQTGGALNVLVSEPDTQFNTPRWSPDGRFVAAERHVLGRLSDLVLVDATTGSVRVIASATDARFSTPAWRPDGRGIVTAAAFGEAAFQLYEIAFDADDSPRPLSSPWPPSPPGPLRQLTHVPGGATWPDISPDGTTIVFVGYTTTGFDLFELPYPPVAGVQPRITTPGRDSHITSESVEPPTSRPQPLSAPYRPWATLAPTSWWPVVAGDSDQLRVGIASGGGDVLGYHSYGVSATWLAAHPSAAVLPSTASPDWLAEYEYTRWRPTLWLAASTTTSFSAGPADASGRPLAVTMRERLVEGGLLLPIDHVRQSQVFLFSLARGVDDFMLPAGVTALDRAALRGAWAFNSAHVYQYSVSREAGLTIGVTAETSPRSLGSSADASAFTVDGRLYLPALAVHHVLAVRLAGGASSGDDILRRTFHLGGAQANASVIDFGRDAISLLRGFADDTFAGPHVALLNVDYRMPLARPQRGYGTWPLFLHTVHAAAFVDAGEAWDAQFDAGKLKTSVGGELSFDTVAGYVWRFTTAVGAAWGHDASRTVPGGASFYVRIGQAF